MAYNRHNARPLCTVAEFQLFSASLADVVKSLTSAQLKAKVERARGVRDKYRDLYRRQRLEARARTGTKKGAAERTKKKIQIFDEALKRFSQAARVRAAADKRSAGQVKKRSVRAVAKQAAARPARKKAKST